MFPTVCLSVHILYLIFTVFCLYLFFAFSVSLSLLFSFLSLSLLFCCSANLEWAVTNDDIRTMVAHLVRNEIDIRVVRDMNTGRSRGFAFINCLVPGDA